MCCGNISFIYKLVNEVMIQILAGGASAFTIFLVLMDMLANRANMKVVKSGKYIEVVVLEKLEVDRSVELDPVSGSSVERRFPIYARDCTSGYEEKIYIDEKQYESVSDGQTIRINVLWDFLVSTIVQLKKPKEKIENDRKVCDVLAEKELMEIAKQKACEGDTTRCGSEK